MGKRKQKAKLALSPLQSDLFKACSDNNVMAVAHIIADLTVNKGIDRSVTAPAPVTKEEKEADAGESPIAVATAMGSPSTAPAGDAEDATVDTCGLATASTTPTAASSSATGSTLPSNPFLPSADEAAVAARPEVETDAKSEPAGAEELRVSKTIARLLSVQNTQANVDQLGTNFTALHIAAMRGHLEIVRLLVRAGVDTSVLTSRNLTATGIASKKGQVGVVQFLARKGTASCAMPVAKRKKQQSEDVVIGDCVDSVRKRRKMERALGQMAD
eukprot:g4502.t1